MRRKVSKKYKKVKATARLLGFPISRHQNKSKNKKNMEIRI
jgi:hypothetical protein